MLLTFLVTGVQTCDLGSTEQEGDRAWTQSIPARMTVVTKVLWGSHTLWGVHTGRGSCQRGSPGAARSAMGHFSCCLITQPDSLDLRIL